jgi:hypothetical protein
MLTKYFDHVHTNHLLSPFTLCPQLFTIVKLWDQLRCPSSDVWKKKMYVYIIVYYSVIKKNEIVSSAEKWMELEPSC